MSNHIIHKQKVVLILSGNTDAFSLQNKVSDLLRNGVRQKLEALFDRLERSGPGLRLEQLELDLGSLPDNNLEEVFTARLLEKMEAEISCRQEADASNKEGLFQRQPASAQDALYYFLQHGRLPWYKPPQTVRQWEQELQTALTGDDWSLLLQWLKTVPEWPVLQRLLNQFSDEFLFHLVQKSKAGASIDWRLFFRDVLLLLQRFSALSKAAARQRLWTFFWQQLTAEKEAIAWDKTTASFLQQSAAGRGGMVETVPVVELKTALAKDVLMMATQQLQNRLDDDSALHFKQEKTTPAPLQEKVQHLLPEEELFVSNCGLVMLHPFLVTFFTTLQLVADRSFIDAEAQQRAVLLLHYLATGQTEAGEFNLVLQKLLCGYPLEETLPAGINLSERETEEAGSVLKTVTEYWPPLNNTSVEGLQQAFLQRDGKLERSENGWRLTVEQKTVDILLTKLPWGFSTIRLPWMNDLLRVDW